MLICCKRIILPQGADNPGDTAWKKWEGPGNSLIVDFAKQKGADESKHEGLFGQASILHLLLPPYTCSDGTIPGIPPWQPFFLSCTTWLFPLLFLLYVLPRILLQWSVDHTITHHYHSPPSVVEDANPRKQIKISVIFPEHSFVANILNCIPRCFWNAGRLDKRFIRAERFSIMWVKISVFVFVWTRIKIDTTTQSLTNRLLCLLQIWDSRPHSGGVATSPSPQPHLSPSMHLQRSQVSNSPGKIRLTRGIDPYRHLYLPLPMHQ